jgi:hypothetical protein
VAKHAAPKGGADANVRKIDPGRHGASILVGTALFVVFITVASLATAASCAP